MEDGGGGIERREECDARWKMEEDEVVAFQEIVDDIEFMLTTQDFVMISEREADLANKRTKYGYLFQLYKIVDEEARVRKDEIVQDEDFIAQTILMKEWRMLIEEVDDEIRKYKQKIER